MWDFSEKCHIFTIFLSLEMLILNKPYKQIMQLILSKTVLFEVFGHGLNKNESRRLIEPYFESAKNNLWWLVK